MKRTLVNLLHVFALRATTLLTLVPAAALTAVALHASHAIAQTDTASTDHDVSLATLTGTLYGSELVPKVSWEIPVVLLHAGSGSTDRNGNSAGLPGANNSLKLLAEALARQGIATLQKSSYSDPKLPVSDELVNAISGFVKELR